MNEKASPRKRVLGFVTWRRVLLALGLLVVAHTLLNRWAYSVLEREVAQARSSGTSLRLNTPLPLTFEEFQGLNATPNAAPFYRAAFALIRPSREQLGQVLKLGEDTWSEPGPPSVDLQQQANQYLGSERVTRALELIDEANRMSWCLWVEDYSSGYGTVIPHLSYVREVAKLILLRARLRYAAGDQEGAVADVQSAMRLAASLEFDRFTISELVQDSCLERSVTAIAQMAETAPMSAQAAGALGKSLVAAEPLLDVTEALRMEAAIMYDVSEKLLGEWDIGRVPEVPDRGQLPRRWLEWRLLVSYPFRPLYRLEQTRLIQYNNALISLSQQPYYMAKDRLRTLEVSLHLDHRAFHLVSWLASTLTKLQSRAAKTQALLRAASVGLALEAYRDAEGAYPESLAVLSPQYFPEVPVDPFTGKGLVYRLTDHEVLVYSIGDNGKDDRGLKETEKAGKKVNPGTDDIAWRVSH
jgi:hypothetical protein